MDYASSLLRIVRIILDMPYVCIYVGTILLSKLLHFLMSTIFRLAIHGLDMYKSTLRNAFLHQSHA